MGAAQRLGAAAAVRSGGLLGEGQEAPTALGTRQTGANEWVIARIVRWDVWTRDDYSGSLTSAAKIDLNVFDMNARGNCTPGDWQYARSPHLRWLYRGVILTGDGPCEVPFKIGCDHRVAVQGRARDPVLEGCRAPLLDAADTAGSGTTGKPCFDSAA